MLNCVNWLKSGTLMYYEVVQCYCNRVTVDVKQFNE